MQPVEEIPKDYVEIAEKIRSGEFFRESRNMYDFTVHDPMVERYLYVLITAMASLIFLIAFVAVRGLYPLQTAVPFIVSTNNIVEELPNIKSLLAYKGEDPSAALLRFMVQNYVVQREEYNIDNFDRDVNGVKSQSSDAVYQEFQRQIDPRNPLSPITLYQRHSRRAIAILSVKPIRGEDSSREVIFEETVANKSGIKKSLWQAIVAFNYSGVTIDEDTGQVKPIAFTVAQYRVKRLQDSK